MAQKAPSIPLPTDWPKHVKVGILHVIALAQVALTAARARSATKRDIIARLRDYRGTERLAILELRAARGWSKSQTAGRLLLRSATIAGWMKRIDEDGEDALVKTTSPVNRFPDFVRYIVQRLKVLCPTMGNKRMAQTLARAGLRLGVSTVGRILKEGAGRRPEPVEGAVSKEAVRKVEGQPVHAKAPNHVWQVDSPSLNAGPSRGGWHAWLIITLGG